MSRSVTDDDLQRWFTALYAAFNARDIPALLAAMAPDVVWPNGWEGGIVRRRDAVRDDWERQRAQIDPTVTPTAVEREPDGRTAVSVRQVVRDREGTIVVDGHPRISPPGRSRAGHGDPLLTLEPVSAQGDPLQAPPNRSTSVTRPQNEH